MGLLPSGEVRVTVKQEVDQLPIEQIDPSPFQPRGRFDDQALDELAASIRQHGVIQPIIVRRAGGRFQVIAGERRLRAARRVGLGAIPAIVRSYSDEEALEAALIENLQRADISVVEAARAYHRLAAEFGYTQGEIAQRTGKSRSAIANTLRLLQLPETVLETLDRGELTEGHARALLALPYGSLQADVSEWVVRNAVSVRELERKVRELGARSQPAGAGEARGAANNAYVADLEERLRHHFGTKAGISYHKGKGAVSLEFYTDEDLSRLVELMGLT